MNAFAERVKAFFGAVAGGIAGRGGALPAEAYDDLTDLLVEGDFGAAEATRLAGRLREACGRARVSDGEGARRVLADLLEETLRSARPLPPAPERGRVALALLLGVNGVGKTTTAAKLAARALAEGRRPLLAAGDTFRAAAIDQLKIHGERLGVRVVAHQHGGDPAAVIYDAVDAARAGAADLIIADTAGRMHTRAGLVEELKKIDRVVESRALDASRYTKYLVLDATTGRNALNQAETFCGAVSPSAVILTKYDSSARGGVVFSIAETLRLPVAYVCDGERYEDIHDFDPHVYAEEFVGLV